MNAERRLLHDLVSIRSVTGDTAKAVEFLVGEMRERGATYAEVDAAGNAVGVFGPANAAREILLVGHIDTVPGDLPVRDTGTELTGRGSVDAKGCLAAFVAAAARLAPALTDARIVVVGCCDEEGESHGARHLLSRYNPEALVIGEPSGIEGVTIGYKGIVKIRYMHEEDLQHTGAPFPTVADRGIAFWTAIQGYLAPLHGESLFDTPTVKLTQFNTTLLPNGRDHVELSGSVRIPPDFDAPAFLDFLRTRAGNATLDVPEWSPAHVASKNTPLTRAFIRAIREEGLTPRYVKKTGTSDMNLLAPRWCAQRTGGSLASWHACGHACDYPVVAYGPGDAALDHTPQERIRWADYEKAIAVLERALGSLVT